MYGCYGIEVPWPAEFTWLQGVLGISVQLSSAANDSIPLKTVVLKAMVVDITVVAHVERN